MYDEASGELLTVSEEEFLPGALACEMDLSAPREALKAQAVAILTLYGAKRGCGEAPLGGDFTCHTAEWQVYVTREAMEQRWGEAFGENYALLQEVAQEVEGEALTYQGEAAMTPYFAISAGATVGPEQVWAQESAGAFPYHALSQSGRLRQGYRSSMTLTGGEIPPGGGGGLPGAGAGLLRTCRGVAGGAGDRPRGLCGKGRAGRGGSHRGASCGRLLGCAVPPLPSPGKGTAAPLR